MSGRVVCIGGLVLDRRVRVFERVVAATSNPAAIDLLPGGVAGNVAAGLARLGVPVSLVSAVGEDDAGRLLLDGAVAAGVDVSGVRVVQGAVTAQYVALLEPDGELYVAAAAMDVLGEITADDARFTCAGGPGGDDWVFAEANLTSEVLAELITRARTTGVRLAVDAVSVPKAARLPADLRGIALLFANLDEARALIGSAAASAAESADALVARGAAGVVVTLGSEGAMVVSRGGSHERVPAPVVAVRDVTGAGDALIAATLARLVRGSAPADAVAAGIVAATAMIGG